MSTGSLHQRALQFIGAQQGAPLMPGTPPMPGTPIMGTRLAGAPLPGTPPAGSPRGSRQQLPQMTWPLREIPPMLTENFPNISGVNVYRSSLSSSQTPKVESREFQLSGSQADIPPSNGQLYHTGSQTRFPAQNGQLATTGQLHQGRSQWNAPLQHGHVPSASSSSGPMMVETQNNRQLPHQSKAQLTVPLQNGHSAPTTGQLHQSGSQMALQNGHLPPASTSCIPVQVESLQNFQVSRSKADVSVPPLASLQIATDFINPLEAQSEISTSVHTVNSLERLRVQELEVERNSVHLERVGAAPGLGCYPQSSREREQASGYSMMGPQEAWSVQPSQDHRSREARPMMTNDAFTAGEMVMLQGLKVNAHLNGTTVEIVEPFPEEAKLFSQSGRMIVLAGDGQRLAVRPECFQRVRSVVSNGVDSVDRKLRIGDHAFISRLRPTNGVMDLNGEAVVISEPTAEEQAVLDEDRVVITLVGSGTRLMIRPQFLVTREASSSGSTGSYTLDESKMHLELS